MPKNFILFDMDGVLLRPQGYHKALSASVKHIGVSLGVPEMNLTEDHIAKFETLNITNEWDSLAICAALTLLHVWKFNAKIRLNGLSSTRKAVTKTTPNIDEFLNIYHDVDEPPGKTANKIILDNNPWLDEDQKLHLKDILENCRDIRTSLTLTEHQERVLGSQQFYDHYKMTPKADSESFLLKYDKPLLNKSSKQRFNLWLQKESHFAGIMTNRPSQTPPGFLSSPEAELGIRLIEMEALPYLGSGMLGWFAETQCQLPNHTLLKPNPVHALALLQMCLGKSAISSLHEASNLWRAKSSRSLWESFSEAKVTIFEDSVKGLISGVAAKSLMSKIGIDISLRLIGVSTNQIKISALRRLTHDIIPNINDVKWHQI